MASDQKSYNLLYYYFFNSRINAMQNYNQSLQEIGICQSSLLTNHKLNKSFSPIKKREILSYNQKTIHQSPF